MKHSIQIVLISFLAFACAALFAPPAAVAQQSGSNPATLTLQNIKTKLKQNKKYIKQVKKSAKANDPQGLNTALQNYDRNMQGLDTAISHGGIQGTPSQQQDAYNRVQSATQKHINVLNSLLSKVPEQAVPHIKHAIQVSQMGQTTALSHLSQLQTQQQAMGQANRPSFGQAGGMGRSNGMGRSGQMGGFGAGNAPMGGPSMGAGMGGAAGPPAGVGGGHGR